VYAAAEGQGVPGGTTMSAHRRAQESHGYGRTRGVDDGQSLVCLSRKGPLKKSAGLEAAHQPHVRPTHHKRAPPRRPTQELPLRDTQRARSFHVPPSSNSAGEEAPRR